MFRLHKLILLHQTCCSSFLCNLASTMSKQKIWMPVDNYMFITIHFILHSNMSQERKVMKLYIHEGEAMPMLASSCYET